jgi:hypothetical protein
MGFVGPGRSWGVAGFVLSIDEGWIHLKYTFVESWKARGRPGGDGYGRVVKMDQQYSPGSACG